MLEKYKTVKILVGHLQIPSFLVSQTDFPPHPSQDNQFIKLMVFVPAGLIMLDALGGVEEAAKNRAFRANADPLLL